MTPNLNRWYTSKCEESPDHNCDVQINTAANSSWVVTIKLSELNLERGDRVLFGCGKPVDDGKPWLSIQVSGDSLVCACSPERVERLDQLLGTYLYLKA
ncbi:MAG: hypothetical protein GY940_41795 [bacterium]|nr:hypothetical protein [bacterium]